MFRSRPERKLLVGVVHLAALPGAPAFGGSVEAVLDAAARDAEALEGGGADALILENFGDVPFFKDRVPPETVAAMARALAFVGARSSLTLGVNVLRNDARAALGLCAATGAGFLRVNVHVGAATTDQGVVEGRAAETLRERARLCPAVELLADVHVKHAVPLGEPDLVRAARETRERGGAPPLLLSGAATGEPPRPEDLERVREALAEATLLLGSGLEPRLASELLAHADGALVGTWLKRGGRVGAPVDPERVRRLRVAMDALG